MKRFIHIFIFSTLLIVGGVLLSCKEHSHTHSHEGQSGKEYTSLYTCPNHCEGSGSDTKGTCPVCETKYVKTAEADDHGRKGHDHSHGEGHEGHSH